MPIYGQRVHPALEDSDKIAEAMGLGKLTQVVPSSHAISSRNQDSVAVVGDAGMEETKLPIQEFTAADVDWFQTGWVRTESGSQLPPQMRISKNEHAPAQISSNAILSSLRPGGLASMISTGCKAGCSSILSQLETALEAAEVSSKINLHFQFILIDMTHTYIHIHIHAYIHTYT
jgi:hypothetical protein